MHYKIAIVTPWFGENQKGDAEIGSRQLALNLEKSGHEISILTTHSKGSSAFFDENELCEGTSMVSEADGSLQVLRFPFESHDADRFNRLKDKLILTSPLVSGISPLTLEEEQEFRKNHIRSQILLTYIEAHIADFDAFLFLSFESTLVQEGVLKAKGKAILMPYLEDKSIAYLNSTSDVFLRCIPLLFPCQSELELAGKLYGPSIISYSRLIGEGSSQEKIQAYEEAFAALKQKQNPNPDPNVGSVVQLVPEVKSCNAITEQVVGLNQLYLDQGYQTLMLADEIAPEFKSRVGIFEPAKVKPNDILILHLSIPSQVQSEYFKSHRGKKFLIYHNITPYGFYKNYSRSFASKLEAGRIKLPELAEFSEIAYASSDFSRQELEMAGFENTAILPPLVDPAKWNLRADLATVQMFLQYQGAKHILFVGDLAPNKDQKSLVELLGLLKNFEANVHLWILGGVDEENSYGLEVEQLCKKLKIQDRVHIAGWLSKSEIMAYYQSADLYLSMSDHEGFGLPLVEAMWFDLPVFAFASSAVSETMGVAAFVFYDKTNLRQLAKEVAAILQNPSIKTEMLALQRVNRQRFTALTLAQSYVAAIESPSDCVGVETKGKEERTPAKRPRWAIVVQRFGKEVVGGSESMCRLVSEHMSKHVDVDVITTCAFEYKTWENHYPEGEEQWSDSLRVRRFPVEQPRDIPSFTKWERANVFKHFKPGERLKISKETSDEWIRQQGPDSPKMIEYLKENHDQYDALVFFTYLYYGTYHGASICPEKSWMIPTAHDEPPIYLPTFDPIMDKIKGFAFVTPAERAFMNRRFSGSHLKGDVVALGIDPPEVESVGQRFRDKYSIDSPFIFYIGRLEYNKGLNLLFDYFIRYKKKHKTDLKLVLAGKTEIEIPSHPDITFLGFISEQEKHDAMDACELLVNPSPFESLSMILLEAWYNKCPVLVNGKCEVMVDQTKRADGGSWFDDYEEFTSELEHLIAEKRDYSHAKKFVQMNYAWPVIEERYLKLILDKT